MKKILIMTAVVFLLSFMGCIGKEKIAVIETPMGVIKFRLYEKETPITTSNFIKLAKDGFYDGLIFHRIVDNFVIQGGGYYPNGTLKQSPYGTIKLEINPKLTHVDGAVGMARSSQPDSATSQFYICDGPQHFLDGNYAVFGKVIEGMEVVRAIASLDPAHTYTRGIFEHWPKDEIIHNVTITRIYIE